MVSITEYGYYGEGWGWWWVCNYEDSGVTALHAHLLGTNGIGEPDETPSVILCIIFYLLAAGAFYRYRYSLGYSPLQVMGIGLLATAIAFTIRAAYATASSASATTVAFSQLLFLAGQLLLLDAVLVCARDLVHKVSRFNTRAPFTLVAHVVLLASFIIDVVAFADYAPTPINSYDAGQKYSVLRLIGALMPFLVSIVGAGMMVMEKGQQPVLGWVGWGPCFVAALLLVLPAIYVFLGTAITDDTNQAVCSTLFFYLAFGLCQALAVLPALIFLFPDAHYHHGPYFALRNPHYVPTPRAARAVRAEARLAKEETKLAVAEAQNARAHAELAAAEEGALLGQGYGEFGVAEPHYHE